VNRWVSGLSRVWEGRGGDGQCSCLPVRVWPGGRKEEELLLLVWRASFAAAPGAGGPVPSGVIGVVDAIMLMVVR
jgi:hypothetical protein